MGKVSAHDDALRVGTDLPRLEAEVARILAAFERAGAVRVEMPALLPAETLLDLYGEDIRTRAYTTTDPVEGERMLRPDFTVPLVQMHAAEGQEPARYAYSGPVWRRQEPGSRRPTEYLQTGFELFDGADNAAADAEVFALFHEILRGRGLMVATGDIGLIRAGVEALGLSGRRRAALLRHVWRPRRFRQLLERFSAPPEPSETRAALLEAARAGRLDDMIGGPVRGLRSRAEIIERAEVLAAEAEEPPIAPERAVALDRILAIKGSMADALDALARDARLHPALEAAHAALARRAEAFEARGIAPAETPFEAQFGRSTLEYYGGFVFGFFDPARPDLSPLASGGRYDDLTAALDGGAGIPAVGGIVKPQALLALGEAR